MRVDPAYKHSELTDTIIGVFYSVYNELGYGFLESVYRNSLQLALREKGTKVEAEVAVPVFFRGRNVRRCKLSQPGAWHELPYIS